MKAVALAFRSVFVIECNVPSHWQSSKHAEQPSVRVYSHRAPDSDRKELYHVRHAPDLQPDDWVLALTYEGGTLMHLRPALSLESPRAQPVLLQTTVGYISLPAATLGLLDLASFAGPWLQGKSMVSPNPKLAVVEERLRGTRKDLAGRVMRLSLRWDQRYPRRKTARDQDPKKQRGPLDPLPDDAQPGLVDDIFELVEAVEAGEDTLSTEEIQNLWSVIEQKIADVELLAFGSSDDELEGSRSPPRGGQEGEEEQTGDSTFPGHTAKTSQG
eukprot:scaffold2120_cov259-Pinguiococcus_pyrenoidosus.AAC.6